MELRTNKPTKTNVISTRKREDNIEQIAETDNNALNNAGIKTDKNTDNKNLSSAEKFTTKADLSPKTTPNNFEKLKSQKVNIHKNHRSRLKTQFLEHGINSLSDIQKLELLLFYSIPQKDTNPLAHKLLDTYGSIRRVLSANYGDLTKLDGIKESSALLIKFVNEISNFINMPEIFSQNLSTSADARAFCSKFYHNVDVEQFYVICLTKSNRVKKYAMINSGLSDEVEIPIREVTQLAIEQKCNRIIICHNHPFGSCAVSNEDFNFTFSLLCSCLLNNIDIVDHIIVGVNGTSSFKDFGLMTRLLNKANNLINIPKETRLIISESEKAYVASYSLPFTDF